MQRYFVGPVAVRKRKRLPHWDCDHGIYAVTFNLFDAIPADWLARMRNEAEAARWRIRREHGEATIAERQAISNTLLREVLRTLDSGSGCAFMRDPAIAKIVADALTSHDAEMYSLYAWSVMPNHVHVVFELGEGARIDEVIRHWKGASARYANRALGRVGLPFWQEDYFDRTIRGPQELGRWINYVASNPVKAGLANWPWVHVYAERIAEYLM